MRVDLSPALTELSGADPLFDAREGLVQDEVHATAPWKQISESAGFSSAADHAVTISTHAPAAGKETRPARATEQSVRPFHPAVR